MTWPGFMLCLRSFLPFTRRRNRFRHSLARWLAVQRVLF